MGFMVGSYSSYAQSWRQLSTKDFSYFYKEGNEDFVSKIDSNITDDLSYLQKRLNYHASNQMDVFLVSNKSELTALKSSDEPGTVNLSRAYIVLDVNQSINKIALDFKYACTKILIDEMMYGGTLQDKIKSNNLINLPSWAIPGLQTYLAHPWSPETDNSLRFIHDERGLSDFNAIPSSYDDIKGASFWKFLEYEYGPNAIPTLLYMARLTRKFNASIYYSFQTSIKDVFENWQDFYTIAYQSDQNKPNPVQGIVIDKSKIIDIYVKSETSYYLLEENLFGIHLFKYNETNKSKKKILSLSKNETPLPKFSGSIFQNDEGLNLIVNTSNSAAVYTMKGSHVERNQLSIPYISVVGASRKGVYLAQAQVSATSIYKYGQGKATLVNELPFYTNSITSGETAIYYIKEEGSMFSIGKVYGDEYQTIFISSDPIKQLVFASDSALIYNSSENGIWNGKILSLQQLRSQSVTNYRSNIIFHQYSPEVFVEFLDRQKISSLSITDYIKPSDFYKYESLQSTYFSDLDYTINDEPVKIDKINLDSLEPYTFQNDVHPTTDFTVSDYDSLLDASTDSRSISAANATLAPDYFSPSVFTLSLVNRPEGADYSFFAESYKTLLPNYLNIKSGILFTNKFSTRSIEGYYLGAIQLGARDISIKFSNKKKFKYQVSLLNRKRTVYTETDRDRYITSLVKIETKNRLLPHLNLNHSLQGFLADQIPLATDGERLRESSIRNVLTSYNAITMFLEQYAYK